MLTIKNTEVFGLERAIKASGNPMTIGEIDTIVNKQHIMNGMYQYNTDNEKIRAKKLGSAERGSGHDNFLSGIIVSADVCFPNYWLKEFQRYHFAQIVSSQSTMHRLTTMGKSENFSNMFNKYVDEQIINIVKSNIDIYNHLQTYKQQNDGTWIDEETKFCVPRTTEELKKEKYEQFMKCVSNLPMGFEMEMTITTNYLQLKTIYFQRRNHKLKEDWGAFCDWCESLPMFKELVGIE